MLESLIKCGCFDSFGIYRSRLIAVYDAVLDKYQAQVRNNLTGQFDIFSMAQGVGGAAQIVYPQIPEYPKQDLLSFEKELTGMYFSGHLFDTYTKHAQTLPHTDLAELAESFDDEGNSDRYRDRQPIAVVGFVVSVTEKKTRSGVQMAFFTLEDRGGSVEILAFPKQYETYAPYLKRGIGLYVEGTISIREGEPPKIVLEKAVPLIQNDAFSSASVSVKQQQTEKKLYLRVASVSDEAAKTALKILSYVPGETPVVLYDISSGQYLKSRTCLAQVTDKLLSDLRFLLGNDNVVYR